MLRVWNETGKLRSNVLYQTISSKVKSTEELLVVINAKLPCRLFSRNLTWSVCEVSEAYWPRILSQFKFEPEYEKEAPEWFKPVNVITLEEFKAETLNLVKAGLWKLKLGALSNDDESIIRARLAVLKEAYRLASKFAEVYVRETSVGRDIRDASVTLTVPFDTKGEKFERMLLGEDQIWFGKYVGAHGHSWFVIFGDGDVPEVLDYRLEIKTDTSGTVYIFPLDDLNELIGQKDLEKIKALVGK